MNFAECLGVLVPAVETLVSNGLEAIAGAYTAFEAEVASVRALGALDSAAFGAAIEAMRAELIGNVANLIKSLERFAVVVERVRDLAERGENLTRLVRAELSFDLTTAAERIAALLYRGFRVCREHAHVGVDGQRSASRGGHQNEGEQATARVVANIEELREAHIVGIGGLVEVAGEIDEGAERSLDQLDERIRELEQLARAFVGEIIPSLEQTPAALTEAAEQGATTIRGAAEAAVAVIHAALNTGM